MTKAENIKQLFIAAIERTCNPIAPIILQESYGSVVKLGKMMGPIADKAKAEAFIDTFLSPFSDEQLETIGGDPSFICALCLLLTASLEHFGSNLKDSQT